LIEIVCRDKTSDEDSNTYTLTVDPILSAKLIPPNYDSKRNLKIIKRFLMRTNCILSLIVQKHGDRLIIVNSEFKI